MGKKDATGSGFTPVENYRKQIGKQDYKKSKKELKSAKAKSAVKKSATPVRDTVLIVVSGVLFLVVLYFLLWWGLASDISVIES